MRYVDLFCGAGGLSLGFDNAGFINAFSVEFNSTFAETYRYNFPNHNLIVDDIRNLSNEEIKKLVKKEEVDVVIGGSPCQGFSKAGNIGRRFLDDERNYLFKEFVRVVSVIKPKYFLFENVSAIYNHNKGQTLKEIVGAFEEIGYCCKSAVLNTADYEIPQSRRRFILVGSKGENRFCFPDKSSRQISIKEAIDDLPKLQNGEKSSIPNHNAMKHSESMLRKMKYVRDGGNREDIPIEIRPKSGDARKYIRYDSSKPSVCVTGDMRKIFHYEQNRALTCRELARIQTFPDDFIFLGNSSEVQQQIGNAVPPKLALLLANQIKGVL